MPLSSLIPLLGRDWWDAWDYPSRIKDQCFGTRLLSDDLLPPTYFRGYLLRPRTQANIDSSGTSDVANDDKEFKVSLDVSQFKPEELQVKVSGNYVVIHGKHEEKSDDHGFVAREFTRKYMLPKACEMETVASSLSPEGILTITAPKKALEPTEKQERQIPISQQSNEVIGDGNLI